MAVKGFTVNLPMPLLKLIDTLSDMKLGLDADLVHYKRHGSKMFRQSAA